MSTYNDGQTERMLAKTSNYTRRRPDPPRGLRALASGGITWDAPISDAFDTYRVYADSDADSALARELPKGQTQCQDLTATRAFVSAYNRSMDLESERVPYNAAFGAGAIDTSLFAKINVHNVFTKFQTIIGTDSGTPTGQALLELQNTTPSTGALVWLWAHNNGTVTLTMSATADIFTFQVGGGLDYYAGRSGGVNLMTIRNGATDAYSGIDFMNDSGTKKAFIGWGNVSAPARANALGIGTVAASEIFFVVNNVNQVKFDTSGNLLPVAANTKTLGASSSPFADSFATNAWCTELRLGKPGTAFATVWRFYYGSGNDMWLIDPALNLRLSITSGSFAFSGHLDPINQFAYDIGSANNSKWRDVRISGKFAVNDGTTDLAALTSSLLLQTASKIFLTAAQDGTQGVLTVFGLNSGRATVSGGTSTLVGPSFILASPDTLNNVVIISGNLLGGISSAYSGGFGFTLQSSTSAANNKLSINGNQVVSARKTGWTAATGTATRSSFATSTVSLAQLAEAVKALLDDLISHGLIGA